MARVAYVMENIMGKVGLSGRAFIPMLVGFGCTVPAIMASRGLENKRDRYKVMLVTPFMSCNARLTIYILFSEIFFNEYAMVAAYSMYIIGIFVAIGVSLLIHWTDVARHLDKEDYLLIELPEYKMPDMRTVGIYVSDKVKGYLQKAGTIIFLGTIVIWGLLNFGPQGYTEDPTQSLGALLGHSLVPLLLLLDWDFGRLRWPFLQEFQQKKWLYQAVPFFLESPMQQAERAWTGFSRLLKALVLLPLMPCASWSFACFMSPVWQPLRLSGKNQEAGPGPLVKRCFSS